MANPLLRNSRVAFRGRFIQVAVDTVEIASTTREYDVIHHPGAAAIVPIDARGRVHLVRQYRHPTGRALLEIPAGIIDPGETPEQCALREVEEECGLRAARIQLLGAIFPTPGISNERTHLYLATELTATAQRLDADEDLAVEVMPFASAVQLAQRGELVDGKTVCGLLLAAAHLNQNVADPGATADGHHAERTTP